MSLDKNAYITPEDFNNLKERIITEIKRRSSAMKDENNNILYGSDYSNQPFLTIPTIENKNIYDFINTEYFNKILNFFNNFTNYPGNLNEIYSNAIVNKGDIIYSLKLLLNMIAQLEIEDRISNDDCKNGCMGLCTNTCNGLCKTGCAGCTGTCEDTCDGGCYGGCYGGCNGCGGCGETCGGGCRFRCGSGCENECVGNNF